MPVITVNLRDLERIAKAELDKEKLEEILPNLKIEVEGWEGEDLTYEASHDRADLFSAEGLGRALGAWLGTRDFPKYEVRESDWVLDISEAPSYRPYAMLAIVRNLRLDDEAIRQLFQLQEKLAISYGVHRRLVSIGLYDLKHIKGKVIRYRAVKEGKMVPLGYSEEMTFDEILEKTEKGKAYGHLVRKGEYPVLQDEENFLSFAPVLNAEYNKVTEDTTDVLVDVTGTEPYLMSRVLDVMVTSIAERSENPIIEKVKVVRNGEVLWSTPQLTETEVTVKEDDIKRMTSVPITLQEASRLLKRMLLKAEVKEGELMVKAPPFRVDVHEPVDVIEDVLAAYGYQNVETTVPPPSSSGSLLPITKFTDFLARIMVSMGFTEVFNFTLIDSELLDELGFKNYVKIKNPRMQSYSAVRTSLIPSLLLTAKVNKKVSGNVEAFEIGDVVINEEYSERERRLGLLLMGDYTLTDALAALNGLARELGMKFKYEEGESPVFIKERTAKVKLNGEEVGVAGEVRPEILVKLEIGKPVVIAEVSVDKLLKNMRGTF
ncbi:phenylalanyl-tRNA synthetase subunit beta [Ignicoccus pacificus DSM 13166]|uniref:phenylalanine--tRNA ligase n=1 Tax=Ignicoccus pacificus DSM 13166 TaxID=940294 RepID=A0A977K9Z1_9CREN|nr:phenylalanyl-tRNA synthetase subunit beta [Ignicoccus pacificus DSM 13166]